MKFVIAANVTLRPFVKFASDEAFVCHWLHSSEIMASFVHRNLILGSTKDDREMYQKKTSNLQKFLREYQDLLFNVGKDGSLRIWGLQVGILY
jgi:hypothetical protein